MSSRRPLRFGLTLSLALIAAAPLAAQRPTDSTKVTEIQGVVVTATRTPKKVFDAPAPVHLLEARAIGERFPNTASDLLRELPGVDVAGVGTNQARPIIRGQQGQRILLLSDGLRLNNSRRQQDFGELPALVDVDELGRVEIVRGPASVLYGTDAIGGVINLISREIATRADERLHGRIGMIIGSADAKRRPSGFVEQRLGRFAYRVNGSYRETRDYRAPSGTFGNVTLTENERVHDTGVTDQSYGIALSYDLASTQRVTLRAQRYEAEDAGFGYVRPEAFGDDQPLIRIVYPFQQVDRYTLSYRASAVRSRLADKVEVMAYGADNERRLMLDVFVPFSPTAGMTSESFNYTDLFTLGARAEATKILGGKHLLTYGVDIFRDRSRNSDSSSTTITGFGPPRTTTSNRPQVPNATFRSMGAFLQGDLRLLEPLSLVLGVRAQEIEARTRATDGLDAEPIGSRDRTLVGTANVVYRLTSQVALVGTVSRGFRSPNLVERFFDGPTPEGAGYQRANPELDPERSVNVDLGARVHVGRVSGELFAFRNTLRDGIRISPTGEVINRLPVFENVNVDKLRYEGVEIAADVDVGLGFAVRGSFTHLASKDVLNPNNPIAAGNADKTVGELAYRRPSGRFWASYVVRHNARQREAQIGTSPVGATLPAFTVHGVRGGVRLMERGGVTSSLTLGVDNLTDELYAESANTSFFRPEPRRNVSLGWMVGF